MAHQKQGVRGAKDWAKAGNKDIAQNMAMDDLSVLSSSILKDIRVGNAAAK